MIQIMDDSAGHVPLMGAFPTIYPINTGRNGVQLDSGVRPHYIALLFSGNIIDKLDLLFVK